jgi:diaminopimelate decarboxylase
MNYVHSIISQKNNFYGHSNPFELIEKYGSPLYVYNEKILRQRCREMKQFIPDPHFVVNYSVKANANLELLKIIKDENFNLDVVSGGELYLALQAGFKPEQVLFIGNNIAEDEMKYAIETGISISVDSLSQLEMYGKLNTGGKIALRFNPGIGSGHHEKVITAGKETKFGIEKKYIKQAKQMANKYKLKIIGINQHIGSLFMQGDAYIRGSSILLEIAKNFNDLHFIDFGGGFGIPYHKQDNERRLDLIKNGNILTKIAREWMKDYKKEVIFKIEPGRYISAECGILLGTVHAIKLNYNKKYIGTDIGFNIFIRPAMYNAYHDLEIYRNSKQKSLKNEKATIVGNICESGDIIAKNRMLPRIMEGDVIGILDTGAYCFSMSSNYNGRLRPAEVLIKENSEQLLIRKREVYADLIRNFII